MAPKTRTKSQTPDLYIDNDRQQKTSSDKGKAEVLSDSFATVFVVEPEGELPQMQPRDVPSLGQMEITHDKIKKGPAKSKKKQVSRSRRGAP